MVLRNHEKYYTMFCGYCPQQRKTGCGASVTEETMEKAKKRLNIIDIIAIVVILAAVVFVGY